MIKTVKYQIIIDMKINITIIIFLYKIFIYETNTICIYILNSIYYFKYIIWNAYNFTKDRKIIK